MRVVVKGRMFGLFSSRSGRRSKSRFHLDVPAAGWFTRCRGSILISGWYADDGGLSAERIFVRVGRRTMTCAPCARPDVVEAFPGVIKDAHCGFTLRFTTRPGWKRLKIYAQEPAGPRLLAVRLIHAAAPEAEIFFPPPAAEAREKKRGELKRALEAFLIEKKTLGFPAASARPAVSVLIVVWNQAEHTLACLRSLQGALVGIDAEILIADNASDDATPQLLERVEGARIFRRTCNEGFLMACNFLAAEASGEHLLFLNNDATLEAGAVRRALASLYRRPKIGAVGGRVVLPHGVVQEAGNTIWRDGTGNGYGRDRSPSDPGVLDWKYTDYVSGVFLLTRRADFMRLGGFDPALAPAYCEDVDYCIKLWRDGLAVVCDPLVVVHHFEFGSAVGTASSIALMARNAAVLRRKHGDWLAGQPEARPEIAASRFCRFEAYRGHVLVVDDSVPTFHSGAGAPRAVALMEALLAENWKITFCATRGDGGAAEWFQIRFGSEIGVIGAVDRAFLEKWISVHRDNLDAVFVSRPHNMSEFGALWASSGEAGGCRPRLVYDAEAIYALRDVVRARVLGTPLDDAVAERIVERELGLAADADAIVAVSATEAERFRKHYADEKPVEVLSHTLGARTIEVPGFSERAGLLFVGRLADESSPNVDSILWFIRKVYPLLAGKINGPVRIIGDASALPSEMRRLPGVEILGPMDDVAPYYGQARVFLAPTRFAAGIPLKVVEATRYHLPVVCTSLLAGQLEWRHEHEALVADTAEAFARECLRLHDDAGLWESISRTAGKSYDARFSPEVFAGAVERIFAPAVSPKASRRSERCRL